MMAILSLRVVVVGRIAGIIATATEVLVVVVLVVVVVVIITAVVVVGSIVAVVEEYQSELSCWW